MVVEKVSKCTFIK